MTQNSGVSCSSGMSYGTVHRVVVVLPAPWNTRPAAARSIHRSPCLVASASDMICSPQPVSTMIWRPWLAMLRGAAPALGVPVLSASSPGALSPLVGVISAGSRSTPLDAVNSGSVAACARETGRRASSMRRWISAARFAHLCALGPRSDSSRGCANESEAGVTGRGTSVASSCPLGTESRQRTQRAVTCADRPLGLRPLLGLVAAPSTRVWAALM